MVEMTNTYTIILPVDKRKCRRLAELLELFRQNATVKHSEVERIMPRVTFTQLLYTLKLIEKQVLERHGFRLFEFKRIKREDGRMVKVMEPSTKIEFEDVEGVKFVTFVKEL